MAVSLTLAAIYGVDLMEIVHLNNLGPRGIVHPGDRIIIRLAEGQAPPPTPAPPLTHILREGETAWTVAALYGLTLDELLDLNGITRGTVLYPGDELQSARSIRLRPWPPLRPSARPRRKSPPLSSRPRPAPRRRSRRRLSLPHRQRWLP